MNTKTFALNTDLTAIAEPATDGAPQCAEFIPAGAAITGRDGRAWVNDNPDAIVSAFAHNGADLPIDIEHATEIKGKAGEPPHAVGWIKALQAREVGSIWGLIECTQEGEQLVSNRAYRSSK
ncbi:phage protease [Veronia pacifica]|uniref:Mu-like prophage I protein n=1 Tax=Veronia pacifica TaxID=1080227 RepID=A0A1C3EKN4_9GAMM|nr:phage protease [Veronia pacifica]ODA33790.1 hypothetical protein A8L45_09175 [Veronia pacifica]